MSHYYSQNKPQIEPMFLALLRCDAMQSADGEISISVTAIVKVVRRDTGVSGLLVTSEATSPLRA